MLGPTMFPYVLLVLACWLTKGYAITIYNIQGAFTLAATQASGAGSAAASTTMSSGKTSATNAAAFNQVILQPPSIPSPATTQVNLTLHNLPANVPGLSIPQTGSFFGFSIEMSVVTQVVGLNASHLNPPFLNLMSLVASRAGSVVIRVGGNTQEYATLVPSIPDGKALEKYKLDTNNPTDTPTLIFTNEIIYMLANVSSLVNAKWYLGIPFNDTTHLRLQIAEEGEAILGDNLLGFQIGNEPDLYAKHQHRPENYTAFDYFTEFGTLVQGIADDSNIPIRNNLIAPSVSGTWSPEEVWNTGFIPAYTNSLSALAIEHYPADNCAAAFPNEDLGPIIDPQSIFAEFLTHASGVNNIRPYLNSTAIAVNAGKPFLMFETNSASCGGFAGLSDSFGAALWAIDYGLQMAYGNFSGALLHVGGESVSYNPFTPPPTNESTYNQWTIGPIFYSVLVVAEVLGKTNTSQVFDLQDSVQNDYTPAYSIYENGNLARVVLFNYITDPSGASDYTATISVGGSNVGEALNVTPAQVKVKRLSAPSVSEKFNITWAGQNLGGQLASDGRFMGNETIETVYCDQNAGTCQVKVPAPGLAVVFITDAALIESNPTSTATFATTAVTKVVNTATTDASVVATSNGEGGKDRVHISSTSKGSSDAVRTTGIVPGVMALAVAVVSMNVVLRR